MTGVAKGIQYDIQGKGGFLDGFWRGAVVGAASYGLGQVGGGAFLVNIGYGIATGIVVNGLSNTLDRSPFFEGAITAGIVGGVFAAATSVSESYQNWEDGYGFGTNIGTVKRLIRKTNALGKDFPRGVHSESAKKVATFWNKRFKGPKVKFSWYGADREGNAGATVDGINIPYEDLGRGSDFILSTIAHEAGHFDFIKGIYVPSTKPIVNGNLIELHGTAGYYDAIKNAGRYHFGYKTLMDNSLITVHRGTAWKSFGWTKWYYQIPKRFF
jgi:hypothetical protein